MKKICKQCGKEFDSEDKRKVFCNRSCSATYSNKNRKLKDFGKCINCGNAISARNSKHCKVCVKSRTYNQAKKMEDIKTDAARRRFLIRTHGHTCMVCKCSTWNNLPIPLELDHIDGKSDNNVESNLRLICPNCHAQTPTYKGKNMGNGTRKFIITQRV